MSTIVITALGAITIACLAVILLLVLLSPSTPGRVRLAGMCTRTGLVTLVAWLVAAAVLP